MKITRNLKILLSILLVVIITAGLGIAYKNTHQKPEEVVYVYFTKLVNKDIPQIAPVKREVPKNRKPLSVAIFALLMGPTPEERQLGYSTEIPQEANLIGLQEWPDKIVINMTKGFETDGGSASMKARLDQLIYTITGVENEKPVYLEIEGKRVDYIGGEGVEVTQPLKGSPQ